MKRTKSKLDKRQAKQQSAAATLLLSSVLAVTQPHTQCSPVLLTSSITRGVPTKAESGYIAKTQCKMKGGAQSSPVPQSECARPFYSFPYFLLSFVLQPAVSFFFFVLAPNPFPGLYSRVKPRKSEETGNRVPGREILSLECSIIRQVGRRWRNSAAV